MQIMLMADKLSAADLHRMGIVNEVVPDDQVLPRALEIAEGLADLGSVALETIKEAALTLQAAPLETAFSREAVLGQRAFTSDEAKQGLARFAARSGNREAQE